MFIVNSLLFQCYDIMKTIRSQKVYRSAKAFWAAEPIPIRLCRKIILLLIKQVVQQQKQQLYMYENNSMHIRTRIYCALVHFSCGTLWVENHSRTF